MGGVVAVDCMGGDHGLGVTLPASIEFLKQYSDARVILVGREPDLIQNLESYQVDDAIKNRLKIHHAEQVVEMDEAPASALKNKKKSSLRVAIDLVKAGDADACVSAGNTGALMATARFVLKMLPGIDRPAICGLLPTMTGHAYMLDLGANVDCTAEHMVQFAIMGSTLFSSLEHCSVQPSVGLLNIGEEELKGNTMVKQASDALKYSGLNFIGNVEGDGIFKGHADIIVCDGFVGNVALKASEGLVQMISTIIKSEFKRNLLSRLQGLFAVSVLKRFKERLDPRGFNGAVLIGLKGVVVKSHGSADEFAFKQALGRAYETVENDVLKGISDRLHELHELAQKESVDTKQDFLAIDESVKSSMKNQVTA